MSNASAVKTKINIKMYHLTYSMQRSGEICSNTSFDIKEHKLFHKICHFLSQFGYSKTPSDVKHLAHVCIFIFHWPYF